MYKYIGCKIEAFTHKYNAFKDIVDKMRIFTHKYNTFKHNTGKVRIFTHKYIAFKYIGCKIKAFTHKYNTFKHIVDMDIDILCNKLGRGNTQNQALETGSNHSVLASSAVNIEHWINKLIQFCDNNKQVVKGVHCQCNVNTTDKAGTLTSSG